MALQCPDCGTSALNIEETIELGSDDRSDEVALQILECYACGAEYVAVYEEARRGALDDESVWHVAYPADGEALNEVRSIVASCRDPREADCSCRGHQRAREFVQEETAPGVDWSDPMPIAYVRE